jgi:hypothetical protein
MSEEDKNGFFEQIEVGNRGPIEVIYLIASDVDKANIESGLQDIAGWGQMTGWWNIRFVSSVDEALAAHAAEPCEVLVHLGIGIAEARRIARQCPYLPQNVANFGGFEGFPKGWPKQVVVAQWAAPRETEFGDALATALSKPVTDLIYNSTGVKPEIFLAVSNELFARIAERPQERFLVSPRVFEEAVAEILSRMGYDVQITPYSGDEGRDIIANIDTPAAPLLMLVECKRYAANRPVGIEPITRLWSRLFDDKANIALAVTTSTFAPVAKQFAKTRGYQIGLADGDTFIQWVRSLRTK